MGSPVAPPERFPGKEFHSQRMGKREGKGQDWHCRGFWYSQGFQHSRGSSGIPWERPEFPGNDRILCEVPGKSWNSLENAGIPWGMPEFPGKSRNSLGIPWKMPEGIPWEMLEFPGKHQNSLGIPWERPESPGNSLENAQGSHPAFPRERSSGNVTSPSQGSHPEPGIRERGKEGNGKSRNFPSPGGFGAPAFQGTPGISPGAAWHRWAPLRKSGNPSGPCLFPPLPEGFSLFPTSLGRLERRSRSGISSKAALWENSKQGRTGKHREFQEGEAAIGPTPTAAGPPTSGKIHGEKAKPRQSSGRLPGESQGEEQQLQSCQWLL